LFDCREWIGHGFGRACGGATTGTLLLLLGRTRGRFWQPIPQRRSNLNHDCAWMGSTGKHNGQGDGGAAGNNEDNDDGEEYYQTLQGGGQENGLDQIVFV